LLGARLKGTFVTSQVGKEGMPPLFVAQVIR
jgi:hypothetical protein